MARNDSPATTALIASERRRFADWLGELSADSWADDTLCRGWSVADIVGHVTFPWRVSTPPLLGQMARHRGFDGASRAGAPALARIGPAALIEAIREHADDMTRPPGASIHDLLAEIVIHPLDIALPLDRSWVPDAAATAELLDYLTTSKKGGHYHPAGCVRPQFRRHRHRLGLGQRRGTPRPRRRRSSATEVPMPRVACCGPGVEVLPPRG